MRTLSPNTSKIFLQIWSQKTRLPPGAASYFDQDLGVYGFDDKLPALDSGDDWTDYRKLQKVRLQNRAETYLEAYLDDA